MYLDPEWEEAEAADQASRRAGRRRFLWLLLVGVALAAIGVGVRSLMHDDSPRQTPRPPMIRTVTLPPPPPPPPPKPQERPPEPPKQVETKPKEVLPPTKPDVPKTAPPKPATAKADAKPAGNPLTAAPGTGANPYGLQAGNGSGDTIGGGGGDGGGGGGGIGFGLYARMVQSQLQAALMKNDRTRRGTYSVVANLWLNGSGRVDRVEITRSTGDSALDNALTEVLSRQVIGEAPPPGMPQPITTRISARG